MADNSDCSSLYNLSLSNIWLSYQGKINVVEVLAIQIVTLILAAVISFIIALLLLFGVNNLTVEQAITLITAASTVIAYIIGEGIIDVARINNSNSMDTVKEN